MSGIYPIKIPKKKLDEAKAFQQLIYQNEGYKIPLWQCLTEIEVRKRQGMTNKPPKEGFFGGFRF